MIDLSQISDQPGCYLFKDSFGKIIYVGKAKNLKRRVSSYFNKKNHDPKTSQLVKQIRSVEFIVTNTEVEALIVENNLIKENQPKYNIDLKDSKRYSYLEISGFDFPRLVTARSRNSNAKLFGPFTSGTEREYIRRYLIKTFKLRTCKRMPKKECLRYHIKLCDAPCIGKISKEIYSKKIKEITCILNGKTKLLLKKMTDEMKSYSEKMSYEKALEIREKISAVNYLQDRQAVERNKTYDEDIINYIIKEDKVFLILFNIHKGILSKKHEFSFDMRDNFLEDFILQYYSDNPVPKEIIVPQKIGSALIDYLSEISKRKVMITIPKIGEKKVLLELVLKNIEISFFGSLKRLERLKKDLRLEKIPKIIECFDISHLSGSSTVGSMVQFRDGAPYPSNYRRFKIKAVEGIDDFSSIAEIVKRRYKRLIHENTELPDLIVIDGGKGQLSSAYQELQSLELNIPIIGLAKKLEEVFVIGLSSPLPISKKSEGLLLLRHIRDEAHRFAIKYNRLLRKNNLVSDKEKG